MSCVLLYIGTRRQYPQLEHHTLILSERYKELLSDIFGRKILPDDFSMYLHAPTRTDPDMAPPGCESMYVLVPVANQRSGLDWNALKQAFADRVIDFLEEWGLDDLREEMDIDSMDFLNFVIAVDAATGVEIPEDDYGELLSLDDLVSYLDAHGASAG